MFRAAAFHRDRVPEQRPLFGAPLTLEPVRAAPAALPAPPTNEPQGCANTGPVFQTSPFELPAEAREVFEVDVLQLPDWAQVSEAAKQAYQFVFGSPLQIGIS